MKTKIYYTINNETIKINYLLFERKKLYVIYKINGKEYLVRAKDRRFSIDINKCYVENNY